MKNIFDFATKELSQDAFLCWLFENFDCKDNNSLKKASQFIIKKFCDISDNEKIVNVKTYFQWHKIDILAIIKTDKRNIALFVEDKIFSSEHNQLLKYNETIGRSIKNKGWQLNELCCTERDIKCVYYKTSYLSDAEREIVKNAGWDIWDISRIVYLFNKFADSDCMLLRQYTAHVNEIEKILHKTHEMPTSSEKGLDLIKWKSYFDFEVLPRLELESEKYSCEVLITAYSYTCLCIGKKTESGEAVPYIELRSRDVTENGFSVTLLCYGVDYSKYGDKIKQVEERLIDAPNKLFESKYRRGDQPKQLGRTKKTDENICDYLKQCIKDYDYIMKEW